MSVCHDIRYGVNAGEGWDVHCKDGPVLCWGQGFASVVIWSTHTHLRTGHTFWKIHSTAYVCMPKYPYAEIFISIGIYF